MNSREAVQALLDGKKVRYYKWDKSEYIEMYNVSTRLIDEDGDPHYWNLECYDCSGWELYEESPVHLTPEDVGRRARLRNGNIVLLTWCAKDGQTFSSPNGIYDCNGVSKAGIPEWSIKELLA
jgi:hypothetical protein